jgi:transcriptional regulator with XRE-family HTH domain
MSVDEKHLRREIGRRIKAAREKSGSLLTQEELATRVGLKRTSITNFESGTHSPRLLVLYDICGVLGIEPAELLPKMAEVVATEYVEFELDSKTYIMTRKTAEIVAKRYAREKRVTEREE